MNVSLLCAINGILTMEINNGKKLLNNTLKIILLRIMMHLIRKFWIQLIGYKNGGVREVLDLVLDYHLTNNI